MPQFDFQRPRLRRLLAAVRPGDLGVPCLDLFMNTPRHSSLQNRCASSLSSLPQASHLAIATLRSHQLGSFPHPISAASARHRRRPTCSASPRWWRPHGRFSWEARFTAGDSCTRAGSGDDTVHQRTRLNSTGGGRLYGLTLENQSRGSTTPTSRAPPPRS